MGTARLFSYNLSSNGIITGCTQFGNMAVSLNTTDVAGFSVGNMWNYSFNRWGLLSNQNTIR